MTSPFNGTWKLDKTRSKEWDWKNSRWIPDQLEDEVLTIFIDGNIYDWDLKVNIDPEIRLTHSSIIDGDWTPYMCRSITVKDPKKIHPPKPDVGNPLNMVKFGVGQPTAMVKLVKVNDNIIYRVSRTPDGKLLNYVNMTEVTPEGYIQGIVMAPSGQVVYHRIANRIA